MGSGSQRDGTLEQSHRDAITEGWDHRGMGSQMDGITKGWDHRGMGSQRDGTLERSQRDGKVACDSDSP